MNGGDYERKFDSLFVGSSTQTLKSSNFCRTGSITCIINKTCLSSWKKPYRRREGAGSFLPRYARILPCRSLTRNEWFCFHSDSEWLKTWGYAPLRGGFRGQSPVPVIPSLFESYTHRVPQEIPGSDPRKSDVRGSSTGWPDRRPPPHEEILLPGKNREVIAVARDVF